MVTKQEALRYSPVPLQADIKRRKNNIKIFEETIDKEKKAIENNLYIISQIDKKHPDVAKLRKNIKKIKTNIKTFAEAIFLEKEEIGEELDMITIIEEERFKKWR